MKKILLYIAILISVTTNAQITKVFFQASGLTCSMCSNSIFKSLKTLDFVDQIMVDMKNYTFELSFKSNDNIDFGKIKAKVEQAGFSVSAFYATIHFDNLEFKNNQPVKVGPNQLLISGSENPTLNGEIKVKIVDKGFISAKEWKAQPFPIQETAGAIYHVRFY